MSNDYYLVLSAEDGDMEAFGWFASFEEADDYAELNGGQAARCSCQGDWVAVHRHPVYGLSALCVTDTRHALEEAMVHREMGAVPVIEVQPWWVDHQPKARHLSVVNNGEAA